MIRYRTANSDENLIECKFRRTMGFKDAAEVRKYIGGIFETAFDDAEIGPKLVGTGLVVAFDFTDPEAVVVIDMANKSVRERLEGGPAPMATMGVCSNWLRSARSSTRAISSDSRTTVAPTCWSKRMFPGIHAASAPDRPAVLMAESGRTLSYGELEANSARLASALH